MIFHSYVSLPEGNQQISTNINNTGLRVSDVSVPSIVFSSELQPLLMENMSRWHMRPARSSALPCAACFPIVCLDAACKMNSGLWTMLDCLTSPNMTLTANSKIQGPNLPTAYLPHHVPATAFHQCIVHQLVTSQWVLFHLLEHAQCLSVAALAAKCCTHKLRTA